MKKTFKMDNLDCAHCAAKMEDAISKLPGVEECAIRFMTQKISITAAEGDFPEILKAANECCKKIEKDCRILY